MQRAISEHDVRETEPALSRQSAVIGKLCVKGVDRDKSVEVKSEFWNYSKLRMVHKE
jgi:hypothetical protein